jgi:hypothetical protein
MSIGGVPAAPTEYVVVQPKYCELCGRSYFRLPASERKLPDGRWFDPNNMCPSCEHAIMKNPPPKNVDAIRYDDQGKVTEREHSVYIDHGRDIDKLHRECLRKEAFTDLRVAQQVAKAMRQRHRGKNPCETYKCKFPINVAIVEGTEYYDLAVQRQTPHWHVGGDYKKKF